MTCPFGKPRLGVPRALLLSTDINMIGASTSPPTTDMDSNAMGDGVELGYDDLPAQNAKKQVYTRPHKPSPLD
eukprot:COSAG02_NODE_8447_length_2568_cov_3.774808_1_plen_73_part_00